MQLFMTAAGQTAQVLNMTSTGTPTTSLSGALLKLINNSTVTLNNTTTWGSVSAFVGGYTGYADDTITWNYPSTPLSGGIVAESNQLLFRPTGTAATAQMWAP